MEKYRLYISVIMILVFVQSRGTASESAEGFSLSKQRLLFKPLLANPLEPRVGIFSQIATNSLRLDIGNSIDILQYQPRDPEQLFTFGVDFFTYTILKSERNFLFPVDAVDYLFGINANYKTFSPLGRLEARLRLSHISAHFVDGHFDNGTQRWKDNRPPQTYSREFFDLTLAVIPDRDEEFRFYAGLDFLYHVDPENLSRISGRLGGEYHHEILSWMNMNGGYQISGIDINGFSLRHTAQAGIKFGRWNGPGLHLYGAYFSGYSLQGEYFDRKERYFAIGFLIDF